MSAAHRQPSDGVHLPELVDMCEFLAVAEEEEGVEEEGTVVGLRLEEGGEVLGTVSRGGGGVLGRGEGGREGGRQDGREGKGGGEGGGGR